MVPKVCSIPECGKSLKARGWCSAHYARWKKYGTPTAGGSYQDPILTPEKFWSLFDFDNGCAEWPRGIREDGYGEAVYQGAKWYAHRLSYYLAHGNIPDGKQIDHICHNRACVNPDHLRLVTSKQNLENIAGATSRSKSGVRGVYWDPRRNMWRATVTHNKRQVHVGQFSTVKQAELAAIAKRNELFTHNDLDRVKK